MLDVYHAYARRTPHGDSTMEGQVFCLLCYRIIIAIDFFLFLFLRNFLSIFPLSFVHLCYFIRLISLLLLHQRFKENEHYTHFTKRQAATAAAAHTQWQKICARLALLLVFAHRTTQAAADGEKQQHPVVLKLEQCDSYGEREKWFLIEFSILLRRSAYHCTSDLQLNASES